MQPKAGYYEVTPTPGEDAELLPNDLVYVTYELYQGGTWWVSYQVGRLESRLEEDGRFELEAWSYDPDAMTICFRLRVRAKHEMPERVQLAGGFWLGALFALVGGVICVIAYELGRRWTVHRVLQVVAESDLTPEQKDALTKAIESKVGTADEPVLKPVSDLASGLVILAVAVIVVVLVGGQK